MCIIRTSIICVAYAACLALLSSAYGLDLKYYKHLPGSVRRYVCRDAVRANPELAKELQATAERCVKQLQFELAALAKRHPVLAGIGQAQIELPGAKETEKVLCGLSFRKSTKTVEVPSGSIEKPDKDGCVLYVWVQNILANSPPERSSSFLEFFLVHEIEMRVHYLLRLSEENKDIDKTMRALIGQRIKEMCDEMKKLQTAEDKAADAF